VVRCEDPRCVCVWGRPPGRCVLIIIITTVGFDATPSDARFADGRFWLGVLGNRDPGRNPKAPHRPLISTCTRYARGVVGDGWSREKVRGDHFWKARPCGRGNDETIRLDPLAWTNDGKGQEHYSRHSFSARGGAVVIHRRVTSTGFKKKDRMCSANGSYWGRDGLRSRRVSNGRLYCGALGVSRGRMRESVLAVQPQRCV
jgi:hypothetical protein